MYTNAKYNQNKQKTDFPLFLRLNIYLPYFLSHSSTDEHRLVPDLGCYEWSCNEHGMHTLSTHQFPLDIYPEVRMLDCMGVLF
jgi:hypothetical protein